MEQRLAVGNTFEDYIYVAGRNGFGQLGIDSFSKIKIPQKINFNFKIKLIKCGSYTTVIVSENNEIFLAGKCGYNKYGNFTKVCNLNVKNIFFSVNDEVFIVTDCNEIYKFITYEFTDIIDLQKLEFKEIKDISIVSFYPHRFYFVTKTNDLLEEDGTKIVTLLSKIKKLYKNYDFYFGITEFDELLLYKGEIYCSNILQSLQNKKIEKISVGSSCLVFTKTKELFFLKTYSATTFTKIELKPEITENIIDVRNGLYNNNILILKGNQFYVKGTTFVFGDFSEFTKLDLPTIDSSVNSVEIDGNFFIFYRNYKKENKMQLKLQQILMKRQLADLDFKFVDY